MSQQTVAIVVAAAENGAIGYRGNLPWDLPDDWAQFRARVQGHPVIMGRTTFEVLGAPLPDSRNLVVTHQLGWQAAGIEAAASLPDALARVAHAPWVFIIGGAEIYRQALAADLVQVVYLTRVHASLPGDAFFPALDPALWTRASAEPHARDERHAYAFTVETWVRRLAGG